jgi:DNA-binding HxlR family transcriptional regulator
VLNISSFVGQTKLNVMKKDRSNCPLTSALDIIGDKWSLIIIRDIFLGKKTFTEFIKSSEKNCYQYFGKSTRVIDR